MEFKEAYKKGTRLKSGQVSEKYSQNRAVYRIKATVNPITHLLTGQAQITYFNNSPDTVRAVTFHTYHDVYKPNSQKSTLLKNAVDPQNHQGVIIYKLLLGQEPINLKDPKQATYQGTNYSVLLKKPLLPKTTQELTIHWNYVIPGEGFVRSGAIDSTSMMVGYWYPEMAVLDDINGWDRIAFDAATEFYHDFSDYEISLTVPDNFTVWASVAPENPKDVFSPMVQQRLEQARKSKKSVQILTAADFKSTSTGTTTWKYEAKGFPDFAFALSDHYLWDASMYQDEHGEFFVHTAYPVKHPQFISVMPTIHTSLDVFHHTFPVYPFPYKHFTIFNGYTSGGMEFPGMANNHAQSAKMVESRSIKGTTDEEMILGLTLHEMAHMYFPFLMGINEKKYAWMDEGFAQFTGTFAKPIFPYTHRNGPSLGSQNIAPMMVPTYQHLSSNTNSYTISSAAYHSLYSLLGKEEFMKALHAFMDEWKNKHPTPYDFMYSFNTASGKDLNWFWKRWYFDWGYPDLGITTVKGNNVVVENKGGRPLAFTILRTFKDGTTSKQEVSPLVWENSSSYTHKMKSSKQPLAKVELILQLGGDVESKDNVWIKP
ncbi:M1 family metallopeptidase [Pontibacter saemangeumensis]|uniref:M1 family metallopeptidase n=1 Tax=Pontibacter saemangeumensis TaxID=1084525 RepID=A0ABP8LMN7_9BACT